MKNRFLKPLGGLAAVLVLAFCAMQVPVRSQTTGITISTAVINTTAAAGTSSILALDGKFSNCTIFALDTVSGNVVAMGNGLQGQYGPGGAPLTNGNFGTSGTIAVTTTMTGYTGNVANLPVGAYFTWNANAGTLTAWETCTSANAGANSNGGVATNVTIVGTPVVSITGPVTAVISPAPSAWPESTPGGIPQVNAVGPNGSNLNSTLQLTSSSTTGCNSISTTKVDLLVITNAGAAQTVDVALYDESSVTPGCSAADLIYDPTLGAAQVIQFGPYGKSTLHGLAYKATTASITGSVWIDYR